MQEKSCYFWVDPRQPGDEQCMSVMCVACHQKKPVPAMFWDGSKGYGPFVVACDVCGFVVHDPDKKYE